ncbi:MAG TPA: hypothetical protein VKT28_20070 [Puia sp.]|nr:hypothetical protein [Puia sp.]
MAKEKKKKTEEIVQTNLSFEQLMKKALNTPLPKKKSKKKK